MNKEFYHEFIGGADKLVINLISPVDMNIKLSDTGKMYLEGRNIDQEYVSLFDADTAGFTYDAPRNIAKKFLDAINPANYSRSFTLYIPEKEYASAEISSSVGNVKIDGMKAGSVSVTTKVGNINIQSIQAGEIFCSAKTGNVDITDSSAANTVECSVSVGNANIGLIGENYAAAADSKLGNVTINGQRPSEAPIGGSIPVRVSVSCGNAEINYN